MEVGYDRVSLGASRFHALHPLVIRFRLPPSGVSKLRLQSGVLGTEPR